MPVGDGIWGYLKKQTVYYSMYRQNETIFHSEQSETPESASSPGFNPYYTEKIWHMQRK